MNTQSIAHLLRDRLEARGEYVVMANASTGWFAVFLGTWQDRVAAARRDGRSGPNLVVYRTRSGDPRDHHVVPYDVVRDLLVEDTMTTSEVNRSQRWNLTLKDGVLHVTHRSGYVDVSRYRGKPLLVEEAASGISEEFTLPEELPGGSTFHEGAYTRIIVNQYERNPTARALCIEHYGTRCSVCGFDFESAYGPRGKGYIHVHHIVPLSRIKEDYQIDPIEDLRPVCPNCHAMIHRYSEVATCDHIAALVKTTTDRPQPRP